MESSTRLDAAKPTGDPTGPLLAPRLASGLRSFTGAVLTVSALSLGILGCSRPAAKQPPVRIGINSSAIASALPLVADARGLWHDSSVSVEISGFAAGKLALEALENGSVDIATVAETPVTLEALRGHSIVVLATISVSPYDVVVRTDHGIRGIGDLRGKKVGTFVGSAAEFVLDAALARSQIDPLNVNVKHLAPPDLVSALIRGDLDAISVWQPFSTMAEQELGNRVKSFPSDSFYVERFNIVSTPAFIQRRRDDVRNVLRALIKAEDVTKREPGAAQNILARSTGIEAGTISAAWPRFQLHVVLDASLPSAMSSVAVWAQDKDHTLKDTVFVASRHIETGPLREIDGSRVQIPR